MPKYNYFKMNIERIIAFTKTYFRIPDIHHLEAYKKLVQYIIFITIFLIFIILKSHTSESNQKLIVKNITVRVNTTPAITFYPHIAVVVESRTVDHLVAIVHNVNHHIPSTWPIQIFHGKDNLNFIKNSTLAPLI